MVNIRQLQCCGVKEIIGLSNVSTAEYKEVIKRLALSIFHEDHGCAFYLFSQATNSDDPKTSTTNKVKYGEKFREFIESEKLGTVIETATEINPNSFNNLKVWLWTVDRDRLTELTGVKKEAKLPLKDCTCNTCSQFLKDGQSRNYTYGGI